VKKSLVEKLELKILIKISEKETDMKILPNQLHVVPVLTTHRAVKHTILLKEIKIPRMHPQEFIKRDSITTIKSTTTIIKSITTTKSTTTTIITTTRNLSPIIIKIVNKLKTQINPRKNINQEDSLLKVPPPNTKRVMTYKVIYLEESNQLFPKKSLELFKKLNQL
jgi:hypothetical protein